MSASGLGFDSAIASGSAIASDSIVASGPVFRSAPISSGSTYIAGSNRQIPNIPIEQYKLNVDSNPTVIRKKPTDRVQHVQNVSLKFLKPPAPQQPGDITITQEPDVQAPAAPPLVIRQKPELPATPAPVIVRERPPVPPQPIGPKHITIPGKVIPPPPRKVIVERLPQMPAKPQDIIIERWLGYQRRTRNVVFQPAAPLAPLPAEKNVLIEWESPDVNIRQEFHFLGVQQADPVAYVSQHGSSLVDASRLPREAAHFQAPAGTVLAVNSNSNEVPLLRGAVASLRLIDLNCSGLSEYASQL